MVGGGGLALPLSEIEVVTVLFYSLFISCACVLFQAIPT